MAFQGLRQADGYQAIFPLVYHGFFGAMTAPGLALDPARYEYFHSWGARAYAFRPEVDPELVSLAGARWLYVRAAPGTNVPTVPGLVPRFQDGQVTVYENPAAFERALLVGAVAPQPDSAAVLAALARASLDELKAHGDRDERRDRAPGPEGQAIAPVAPGTGGGGGAGWAGGAGGATIVEDAPDRIVVEVAPDRPSLLVLTDAASPGWVAEVDGRPAPIATVDGAFRGVAIGPQARRVVFDYRPDFTAFGAMAAGLALVVLAGWALVERRRGRRPFGPSSTLSQPSTPAAGRRGADDV